MRTDFYVTICMHTMKVQYLVRGMVPLKIIYSCTTLNLNTLLEIIPFGGFIWDKTTRVGPPHASGIKNSTSVVISWASLRQGVKNTRKQAWSFISGPCHDKFPPCHGELGMLKVKKVDDDKFLPCYRYHVETQRHFEPIMSILLFNAHEKVFFV